MQLSPQREWGRLDITNVFVHVSLSQIALAESARETVSLPRLGMLSTRFFCLEQETVRHSRFMIRLIFT